MENPAGGEEADMDAENEEKPAVRQPSCCQHGGAKRAREDGEEETKVEVVEEAAAAKKVFERSLEEDMAESLGEKDEDEEGGGGDEFKEKGEEREEAEDKDDDKEKPTMISVGPKVFSSSVDMFDYFYNLLHNWSPNLDLNKYEHMVLLDLLKKGHPKPLKKIGEGIQAFQVRYHPLWKSRCFLIIRADGTTDDFSFRECVNNILPLPDNMKAQPTSDYKRAFKDKKAGPARTGGSGTGGLGGG